MSIVVYTTSKFRSAFSKLPEDVQERAEKREQIFRDDPFDPRLNTHKLTARLKDRYVFSVDYRYRILFRFLNGDEVVFENIGTHKIYG